MKIGDTVILKDLTHTEHFFGLDPMGKMKKAFVLKKSLIITHILSDIEIKCESKNGFIFTFHINDLKIHVPINKKLLKLNRTYKRIRHGL